MACLATPVTLSGLLLPFPLPFPLGIVDFHGHRARVVHGEGSPVLGEGYDLPSKQIV